MTKGKEEKDRHLQKSGMKDLRGLPKKQGAGGANWGAVGDDEVSLEEHRPQETGQHIQVVDQSEFEKLKHNMLIAVAGTKASGKRTVAQFLVDRCGFELIHGLGDTEAVDYVLQENRWQRDFVMFLKDPDSLPELAKRPFFLLVTVDAPISLRFKRHSRRDSAAIGASSLLEFVALDESQMFGTGLIRAMQSADVSLVNSFETIGDFCEYLESVDLPNPERCRPSWDTYFIRLCEWAARRSNCMKRRVGCVLVKDSRIIATGYNGTPRGVRNCNQGGCPRCNQGAKCGIGLDLCLCIHAEENALLEAGRERIESSGGHSILYCSTCPCIGCAKKIVQAGVKEVVYREEYQSDVVKITGSLLKEAGIIFRQYHELMGKRYDGLPVIGGMCGLSLTEN